MDRLLSDWGRAKSAVSRRHVVSRFSPSNEPDDLIKKKRRGAKLERIDHSQFWEEPWSHVHALSFQRVQVPPHPSIHLSARAGPSPP